MHYLNLGGIPPALEQLGASLGELFFRPSFSLLSFHRRNADAYGHTMQVALEGSLEK